MSKKHHMLLVEDSEEDALLIVRELSRNGVEPAFKRVDSRKALKSALDSRQWDIVISNFNIPHFNGAEALKLVKQKGKDVPFIIVSGRIGEEAAADMMRAGACDFIMKNNLARLAAAVDRELKEAEIRKKRRRTEKRLKSAEKNYHSIFNTVNDAICIHDKESGDILNVNNKMTEMFGYSRRDFRRLKIEDISEGVKPYTQEEALQWLKAAHEGPRRFEWRCRNKAGRLFWVEVNLKPVTLQGESRLVAVIRDISDRKMMEEELREAAITDEMTGLLNRRGFFMLARQQINIANRTQNRMHLVYIDIDGLKAVNDEHGHKAGDRMIIDAAHILRKTFRKSDIIARIGGDEFAVLLTGHSRADIGHVVTGHINDNLRIYNEKSGNKFTLMLSTGTALYDPDQPCTIDDLLINADQLMYENKRLHKQEKHGAMVKIKKNQDRRAHERVRTGENVFALIDGANAIVKDIGPCGARIKISKPLNINNTLDIESASPDNYELAPRGRVVWSSLIQKSDKHTDYEAGVEFIKLGEGD